MIEIRKYTKALIMSNKNKKMRGKKDDNKDKDKEEEGVEIKEPNPDILESAFESNDPVEPVEGLEEDSPLLGVDLEDEDGIDSGDFRVANDW